MSSVQILHRNDNGEETVVRVVDGDLIKAHSKTVRDMIARSEPALIYRISLIGPTFDSLSFVIEEIVKADEKKLPLSIKLGPHGIIQSCGIHRAIKCMQIEPEQLLVPKHLNGNLAHRQVTAEEMLMVHEAYCSIDNPHLKLFNVMVTTTAWNFVNDKMTDGQKKQLKQAALTQLSLDAALAVKIRELKEVKRVSKIIAEKRAAREAKRAAREQW